MKGIRLFGAIFSIFLAGEFVGLAAPEDPGLLDLFSVGAGIVHFEEPRVYHATTQCREVNYRNCSWRLDKVEVNRKSSTSAVLLLNYYPFGSKRSEDSLLAADGIFTSILTSYGFQAENRRLFDGIGLGYTLGVFDAFGRRDALNFGLGVAWFSDVHVLKDHVTPGRLLPSGSHSPTTQTAMTTPMLDIALHF